MSTREAINSGSQKALYLTVQGLFIFILLAAVPALAGNYSARGLRTYLDVSIEMEKKVYELGELLEGKVVIYNRAPATLFGGFDVKLYKDDNLRYATTIYVKTLFPGETRFRFKNFGIPKLKEDESSLGNWRLVVHQSNRAEDAVEAEFRIQTEEQETVSLQNNHCYTIDAASTFLGDVIRNVFHELRDSALLPEGYPRYGRTEIVGKYDKPHTITVKPVNTSESVDSILVDKEKFITFAVWGFNARAVTFTDFVYLLRETDPHVATNRLQGVKKYRYIEVGYLYLLPANEAGRIAGDFPDAKAIIAAARKGLTDAGAQRCP